MPPHVVADAQRGTTDSCAICHRAHTANASVPSQTMDAVDATGTSLLIASDPLSGDVSLCFACHGVAQLGSNKDVQSRFLLGSVHSLAPTSAPYGPSPLYCSSCHDAHGSDRIATDTPYPALLRAYSQDSTTPALTGEAYCAKCHTPASAAAFGERFAGLAVYMRTGHYSGISTPTTGTGIRCSVCHDPHGSAVAPLLVASLTPTSAPATFTVTADDRTFCIACHPGPSASWPASSTYAASGHGSSAATVSITATWVPAGSRRVGECQVCHAPMGRSDGDGGTIPKLLDATGRVLCDRCHSAGGVASSTETSSQARHLASPLTLAAVYAPSNGTTGSVSLYGRAAAADTALSGPRQYTPAEGAGPSASGDIDGDGAPELVVASAKTAEINIYDENSLTGGSAPITVAVPAGVPITAIAVANIVQRPVLGWLIQDSSEVAVITSEGRLIVYGWTIGSDLVSLGSSALPTGPWGLATGNLNAGGHAEAVVTSRSGQSITIATDDGSEGITVATTPVGGSPVAPSVGELWNSSPGNEIVVGDAEPTTSTVRILDGSGVELAGYPIASGDGTPTATAVGDVLWGVPDAPIADLAVAFADAASGDSTVVVLPQVVSPGSGLDTAGAVSASAGAGRHTGSLLIGNVDGDAHAELVVGNGGTWDTIGLTWVAPSVRVWHSNGMTLSTSDTYLGGGTELAGPAPSLALADFGPLFPSRHPIDEAAAAHVSTETVGFARHVTCSDCHNTHESTMTASAAPLVPGSLKGAWGVVGASATETTRSLTEYGICYKCHSSFAALDGRQDVAAQFDVASVSRHAVEASSTSAIPDATFAGGFTQDSILFCTDCHGDDGRTGDQARGLHESDSAPILAKPYLGTAPTNTGLLCYGCHKYGVYGDGSDAVNAGLSFFRTTEATPKLLHPNHIAGTTGRGLSCSACHVGHGSTTNLHLLRTGIGFVPSGDNGGTCTNGCHGGLPQAWGGTP